MRSFTRAALIGAWPFACAAPTKTSVEPAEEAVTPAQGSPVLAASAAAPAVASADPSGEVRPGTVSGSSRSASASAAPAFAPLAHAPLHDADGKPLPQTEERPSATSPAFLRRMELLVRAIEADDAKLAHDAFFPLVAYEQVKDIAKPALDHERRLLAAFARNVHEYHRELGKDASGLRFVRVELPEDKVKWMKVGSEGNRVGYYRVLRVRLVVATGSDKERSFELTSLISWRGEWYVVHLRGFK